MFGALSDFFHLNHFAAPPAGQAASNTKAPPASKKALATLPMVKVTADDILEATNKECLICLEEQTIGSWACKLQCGHLFHKPCLVDWLEKHCTCPVCRFELETDDSAYELERKKRMKKRKLRLRRDEIQNKSIAQLRELAASLNINITGCLDKTELEDKLVKSGLIEITEGAPPLEMTETEFNQKSVGELRHLLLSFGLSDRNLLEKSEFRNKLKECGRIVFIPEEKSGGSDEDSDYVNVSPMLVEEGSSNPKPCAIGSSIHEELDTASGKYHTLLSDLQASSLTELKSLCAQFGVSTAGCIYKQDIVDRLVSCDAVRILPADQQLEAKADHLSLESDINDYVDESYESEIKNTNNSSGITKNPCALKFLLICLHFLSFISFQ